MMVTLQAFNVENICRVMIGWLRKSLAAWNPVCLLSSHTLYSCLSSTVGWVSEVPGQNYGMKSPDFGALNK